MKISFTITAGMRSAVDHFLWSPIAVFRQSRHKKLIIVFALIVLFLWECVHQMEWKKLESEEKLPLFRDSYVQELWPHVEHVNLTPDQIPRTLHYLWCGRKQFRFQHYLGLLSAIRLLQPLKVVFHYTHLPEVDTKWYNVWFQELKQSFANLEINRLFNFYPCGSKRMLETALGFLSDSGGIFLGENVIVTRFPRDVTKRSFWFAFSQAAPEDVTKGIVVARGGFDSTKKREYVSSILSSGNGSCGTAQDYNRLGPSESPPCILLTDNVFPRDTWRASSSFAELARWLYYGQRKVLEVQTTNGTTIPRIGHITFLSPGGINIGSEFRFLHFLSVISALHVAGLSHVYVHGDMPPRGHWWEELKRENVTFVSLDSPSSVFQQGVRSLSHKSDIARAQILHKYGGVYQDRDVVWGGRLPDWLLKYPAVVCPDWPRNGEWPESFNTGVLMAQPRAPWLRHFLFTMRHFLDYDHAFNAVMMSYRAYEKHPDTLYLDRYLQVICFQGICHPAWHDDYIRDIFDDTVIPFDWHKGRAFHFTVPKPPPSLKSPAAILAGNDLFAELGRHVLKLAGREDLLRNP